MARGRATCGATRAVSGGVQGRVAGGRARLGWMQQMEKMVDVDSMYARPIRPGTMYKVTRRTTQRLYLLLPTRMTHEVFGYCLGVALERFGIRMHAVTVLCNHYHIDITDPYGLLPAFKHLLNLLVARALNAHLGRFENFFASDAPSDVEMATPEEVLDRMVYTLTNPVKDGLVRSGSEWGGLTSYGMRFGTKMVFRRPEKFFDKNGALPEEVEVEVSRPDILPELSDEELFVLLMRKVKERERELLAAAKEEGRRFLGMRRVLRRKHTDRPQSREPRFNLNPRVASRSKWQRIAALQRNKEWLGVYREAWEKFCAGVRDVLFPEGTYLMRVQYGVACAQAP